MNKDTSPDLSWIDNSLKDLKSMPASVLDEVSNTIKKFNSTSAENIDSDTIEKVVDFLTYFFFMFPYNLVEQRDVWRVRPSKYGELFEHTDDLKYPPKNNVKYGRANTPFSPLFYAGSSPETTFAECALKEGDFFHLTKYSLQPNSNFHLHILGDIDSLRRRSRTVSEIPAFAQAYCYALDSLKPEVKLAVQLVDAFFVDRLSRKGCEEEYRITSSIIAELLKSSHLSGIIYPSVEHAGGFNYALKPSCYDNHVKPVEVSAQCVIRSYGYGAYLAGKWGPAIINEYPGNIPWPDLPAINQFRKCAI